MYATLKRVNKYKLKFKSKPWIMLDLQKSISVKNKLFTNFINKNRLTTRRFSSGQIVAKVASNNATRGSGGCCKSAPARAPAEPWKI